jgi:GT2 family glycosyltransferase
MISTKPQGGCLKAEREQWRGVAIIGIVTRNRAAILPRAIASAREQRYEPKVIQVLDDGSDDDTGALRPRYPDVRWQRSARSGLIEARNRLMLAAEGEFYVSLDDDAWFIEGDEVGMAIDYLNANPGVAAVAFDILSPDRPLHRLRGHSRPVHMFIGCGHVVRLSAVREVGLYAAVPGAYGAEEKDLCLRLMDWGWEIHLLPGGHIWHERTTIARDEQSQHASGVCNDLVLALRRCPFPLILATLPIKLARHIIFAVSHDLLRAGLRGIGLFFRNGCRVLGTRAPVRMATYCSWIKLSRQG